jgi:hypothetical protein
VIIEATPLDATQYTSNTNCFVHKSSEQAALPPGRIAQLNRAVSALPCC